MFSPFGATGLLGKHAVRSTLELRLGLNWMELELLVEDKPGVEILSMLLFIMRLDSLPYQ